MGTLFEQIPRKERLDAPGFVFAKSAVELADIFDISFSEALRCIELEYKIDDYDTKDEQLTGFGLLLQELIEVLKNEDFSD